MGEVQAFFQFLHVFACSGLTSVLSSIIKNSLFVIRDDSGLCSDEQCIMMLNDDLGCRK